MLYVCCSLLGVMLQGDIPEREFFVLQKGKLWDRENPLSFKSLSLLDKGQEVLGGLFESFLLSIMNFRCVVLSYTAL